MKRLAICPGLPSRFAALLLTSQAATPCSDAIQLDLRADGSPWLVIQSDTHTTIPVKQHPAKTSTR